MQLNIVLSRIDASSEEKRGNMQFYKIRDLNLFLFCKIYSVQQYATFSDKSQLKCIAWIDRFFPFNTCCWNQVLTYKKNWFSCWRHHYFLVIRSLFINAEFRIYFELLYLQIYTLCLNILQIRVEPSYIISLVHVYSHFLKK